MILCFGDTWRDRTELVPNSLSTIVFNVRIIAICKQLNLITCVLDSSQLLDEFVLGSSYNTYNEDFSCAMAPVCERIHNSSE